jgi:hypothetical protein
LGVADDDELDPTTLRSPASHERGAEPRESSAPAPAPEHSALEAAGAE